MGSPKMRKWTDRDYAGFGSVGLALRRPRLARLLGIVTHDEEGGYPIYNTYRSWSPLLKLGGILHRFTGARRGCSCSTCFWDPRRRVPAREIMSDRVRLAHLERAVRDAGIEVPL